MSAAALELSNIEKRFGRVEVLRGVALALALARGEAHVLAGENGAGKSTLVRILSGADDDFSGTMTIGGRATRFANPREARQAGVATIHQELSLVGSMSVADNLALGRGGPALGLFDRRAARSEAERALAAIGLDVSPDAPVDSLPVGAQQLVEIAKALAQQAEIFLFDEPTSALTDAEAERLFAAIARLKLENKAILFVSHRAADIDRVADRVTVLRDGAVALAAPFAETGHEAIVRAMLGERGLRDARGTIDASKGTSMLELAGARVVDAEGRTLAGPIDLATAAGEIVGLAGLRGSGASELLGALGGAEHAIEGLVSLSGGLAFVVADRKDKAVIPDLDALANATLSRLATLSPNGVLSAARERAAVAPLLAPLGLDRVDLATPLGALSGGTQQKIILLRALVTAPKLLILDEPTRGVDVAAKAEIHGYLRDAAARGLTVVFATTDLDELFALAARIVVFARGTIALDAPRAETSRTAVLAAAMGSKAA